MESGRRQHARFVPVRELGRGGMGQVWLVDDHERGERVAMKRVLGVHGEALRRFKREFRVIEGLLHPNVVRLYELGEDAEGLFFTMEAIEGADLRSWCRGDGRLADSDAPARSTVRTRDAATAPTLPSAASGPASSSAAAHAVDETGGSLHLDRLAHALPQIVEALAFLHGHGVVHRDLKPSNVLVRRDGLVKVLDFGILAELGTPQPGSDGEVVGTIGYMALEQIRGAPPTPASDVYALGCVLFELAAGAPPFRGAPLQVMAAQLSSEPPSLGVAAPDAPAALVQACAALLRRDPAERPSLEELSRTLLPALGARRAAFPAPRPPRVDLVGRDSEQATLEAVLSEAADGRFVCMVLSGATGTGKTSLAEWMADRASRRGVVVLRGRGRPSERVAFNAVDGAIDELAGVLGRRRRRTEPAEVTEARRLATAAFPVLVSREDPAGGAPPASRRGVFDALVRLIGRVAADAGGLLVQVDDLHWADEDSIALLDHLVASAPPRVAIVATIRDDVGPSAASAWMARRRDAPGMRRLSVQPLDDDAVVAVLERAAERAGAAAVEPRTLRRLAEGCGGRPLLAELSGRAVALGNGAASRNQGARSTSARSWLDGIIARADAPARGVLSLVLATDGWVRGREAAALLERRPGEVEDAIRVLERDGLLRRAGSADPGGRVDFYHDVVRAAVAEALAPAEIGAAHGRLADHLARIPDAPAHRRVRHLLGAGRDVEASALAVDAARDAEGLRAYALAADLYRVALRHPGDAEIALRRALARCLEHAAQYREAAGEWRAIGEALGADDVDALLHEAHALLAANEVSEGRRRLDEGLRRSGDPPSGRGGLAALWAALSFLRGPPAARPAPAEPAPDALRRAERDVRIGTMVTYFDPLSGIRFLHRARSAFAREGAALQVAKSDWVFAYLALFAEAKRGPVPLAGRWEASARDWAGQAPELDAVARSHPPFLAGVAAQRDARWSDAATALDAAASELERGGLAGTFEHLMTLVHRAQVDLYGQRMDGVDASVGRLVAAARDTDDSAMRCHVEIARGTAALLRGDAAASEEIVSALAESWAVAEPTFQKILTELMRSLPRLYRGGAAAVLPRLRAAFAEARRFRPFATMYGGAIAAPWAALEAAALREGDAGASAGRVRRLFRIVRKAPPMQTGVGWRALAYVEDARSRPERAVAALRAGRAEAERWGHAVDLAIFDYQLGRRLGADEGRARVQAARSRVAALGIAEALLEEDPGLR